MYLVIDIGSNTIRAVVFHISGGRPLPVCEKLPGGARNGPRSGSRYPVLLFPAACPAHILAVGVWQCLGWHHGVASAGRLLPERAESCGRNAAGVPLER